MNPTYSSKIDWWLALLLIWGAVFPLVVVPAAAQSSHQYAILPLAFLPLAIYGLLVFPCRYTFEPSQLAIQAGLIRIRIPYSEITEWERTRNPLSSPALSLDRLRIVSKTRTVMISPVRQDEFIQELQKRVAATPGR